MTAVAEALEQVRSTLVDVLRFDDPARWSDDELLAATASIEAVGRVIDAHRAACAGEIDERSRVELGSERLSSRRGCRSASELVERVTQVSGAEARRRIALGRRDPRPGGVHRRTARGRVPGRRGRARRRRSRCRCCWHDRPRARSAAARRRPGRVRDRRARTRCRRPRCRRQRVRSRQRRRTAGAGAGVGGVPRPRRPRARRRTGDAAARCAARARPRRAHPDSGRTDARGRRRAHPACSTRTCHPGRAPGS